MCVCVGHVAIAGGWAQAVAYHGPIGCMRNVFPFNYTKQKFCISHTRCECQCECGCIRCNQSATSCMPRTHIRTFVHRDLAASSLQLQLHLISKCLNWVLSGQLPRLLVACNGKLSCNQCSGMPQACVHLCATISADHSCFLSVCILSTG